MKLSISQRCIPAQRGVALLVALLVVALATVLIAGLLDRGELTAARTRNQLRAEQAQAYAQGLEAYAAKVLLQDLADDGNSIDTADDIWALPLPPTPVQGGEIMATMSDLNGRFNLNNLDPAYDNPPVWHDKFARLLVALKLDPVLADSVRAWMDTSPEASANDNWYLSQPVPYRSAKREFNHVSELRLVMGVDGDIYAQLAPYVSALPNGTLINVNTASAPVLMTLGPSVTEQMAQALWQQGHSRYQTIPSDLTANQPGLVVDCGGQPVTLCYDVKSSYFLARGEIALDGLPFTFYSLIERRVGANGGIRVIQRSRGADD